MAFTLLSFDLGSSMELWLVRVVLDVALLVSLEELRELLRSTDDGALLRLDDARES